MSLFLMVQLVHGETLDPVVVPGRERSMSPLVGVTNTTMHRIVIPPNDRSGPVPLGVFAFTDLSVRQEGIYRLRFFLFEIRSGEAIHLTSCDSEQFRVYAAKGFPGMEQSTAFTDVLKKHGIRVRVSKSIRTSKKIGNQVDSESTSPKFDPEDDAQRRLQITSSSGYQASDPWVSPMTGGADVRGIRDIRGMRMMGIEMRAVIRIIKGILLRLYHHPLRRIIRQCSLRP
jgi:hypothetical protein